jgi:hypothetical protein
MNRCPDYPGLATGLCFSQDLPGLFTEAKGDGQIRLDALKQSFFLGRPFQADHRNLLEDGQEPFSVLLGVRSFSFHFHCFCSFHLSVKRYDSVKTKSSVFSLKSQFSPTGENSINSETILESLGQPPEPAYGRLDAELPEHLEPWGVAQLRHPLRLITLESEYGPAKRYVWGNPSPYQLALSLRPDAYLKVAQP